MHRPHLRLAAAPGHRLRVHVRRSTVEGFRALRSAWSASSYLNGISRQVRRSLRVSLGEDLESHAVFSPAGIEVFIRTPHGQPDAAVLAHAETVASDLGAWRVRSLPTTTHGVARFLVQMRDPLMNTGRDVWPLLVTGEWDLAMPVPVGCYEDGTVATVDLWAQTILVGGSPGSGKSVFGWLPLLAAAMDPSTILVVLDLKPSGIETAPVAERADYSAHTAKEARDVLARVWALVSERNAELRARGLAKVPTGERVKFPGVFVMVDEAAELSMSEEGQDALQLLQRIVAVGRASGVSVLLLTQKPDAQTVPSALRDLFAQRVAFRVGNRPQAETILGVVSEDAAPWTIGFDTPGIGYLLGSSGTARRFRAQHVPRLELWHASAYASVLRDGWKTQHRSAVVELPPAPAPTATSTRAASRRHRAPKSEP